MKISYTSLFLLLSCIGYAQVRQGFSLTSGYEGKYTEIGKTETFYRPSGLQNISLNWHRSLNSRHEALITFKHQLYYDNTYVFDPDDLNTPDGGPASNDPSIPQAGQTMTSIIHYAGLGLGYRYYFTEKTKHRLFVQADYSYILLYGIQAGNFLNSSKSPIKWYTFERIIGNHQTALQFGYSYGLNTNVNHNRGWFINILAGVSYLNDRSYYIEVRHYLFTGGQVGIEYRL